MSTPDHPAPFELSAEVERITDAVRRAGQLSLQWYRQLDRSTAIDNKKAVGFDPVTEADRAVETQLRADLTSWFPDHAILGEEFGLTGDGPYRWIIDPIDGTRAFITGQPMWGTLLGLQHEDRPIAGWMHVPPLGETYVGLGPGGPVEATTDWIGADGRRRLAVSGTTDVATAVVTCTHPDMFAPGPQAEAFARLADRVRMVRYSGDCLNYGLLAMGLVDAVVENGLAAYDIVPLIPIIEGAGGIVTDLAGKPPLDGGYVVAAATPSLHQAILDELNR